MEAYVDDKDLEPGRARPIAGSFRDPSGFVFHRDGVVLRQVNQVFAEKYDAIVASGLYLELMQAGLLVPHEEVDVTLAATPNAYKVLRPAAIPFISYPYEWCPSQLREAALCTLEIQERALRRGMVLRDASAYNIQFIGGKPCFIDTLSFEPYVEGSPWVAYRQFCQHFLAPLSLSAYFGPWIIRSCRVAIDGIALEQASKLLPWQSRLNFGLMMHIHIHARSQLRNSDAARAGEDGMAKAKSVRISKHSQLAMVDSLRSCVQKQTWMPEGTEWADYYSQTNYSQDAMGAKEQLVAAMIAKVKPRTVWDVGANTGRFSELAKAAGAYTMAFDVDYGAVERHYRHRQRAGDKQVLPLVMDLTNPSPSLGWGHSERDSLAARGPADLVMALALIHHICISNNVPLARCAEYFARLCEKLIIEFVPKSDSQVRRLLASREDVFPDYHLNGFEEAFSGYFDITEKSVIPDTDRTLYLLSTRK